MVFKDRRNMKLGPSEEESLTVCFPAVKQTKTTCPSSSCSSDPAGLSPAGSAFRSALQSVNVHAGEKKLADFLFSVCFPSSHGDKTQRRGGQTSTKELNFDDWKSRWFYQ